MPAFLLPLLLNLAPTVAGWVAGDKTGKAIEKVTGIVKSVTGIDELSGDALDKAIAGNAELATQLKLALLTAESEEKQRQHEEMLARISDVASARAQTAALAKSGSAIAWGAPAVSLLSLILAGAVAYLVLFREVDQAKWTETVVTMLIGAAIQWVAMVQSYWLGSSSGSANKDSLIQKALGK